MSRTRERLGPRVAILKADGINCDAETQHAFDIAGGRAEIVHINELKAGDKKLKDYKIFTIPGGFSYGDDVASGKVLALELNAYLADQIADFVHGRGGLVLGVCNGFQVLVRTGLLPFGSVGEMQATLRHNDSGRFECRWINLKVEEYNSCVFLEGMPKDVTYQVAHGEGKFYAPKAAILEMEENDQVVFRYVSPSGSPTQEWPHNPNGSVNAIAGITDSSGQILGLMPHPERFVIREQHPNWRSRDDKKPHGLPIFEKMVEYVGK